ncbi:phage shock protein PspC (stress-responsive transcriptional regulator) [Weissella uvarum]|uniref:PspC domain-containing protein n=1 Tax=Weissella uvarum TaxID=1479233 RepID=UPI00195FA377|nr:PspC domain-containing protein [Weissella uvarum]MBM7618041.1 phage shock protein PspC (stress-responsive transcriptional regulator) [Weissella uvarum]MCM0595102.1 PspC domain-containing protein [Weissella uvarum]
MKKKLYKSDDRVLCGVLGGIANYLNVDPTVVRLLFVILTAFSFGFALIFYIGAALIMPDMPHFSAKAREDNDAKADKNDKDNEI